MLAARRNNFEAVKLLVDHGAELNSVNREGDSALILATMSTAYESVKCLVDGGADLNI